jgi:hypothetical protein
MSEASDRLERAKARAAAAKAALRVEDPEQAEIEAAERAADRLEAIALGEKHYGKLGVDFGVISTPRGAVVIKRPSPGEYARYNDYGTEGQLKSEPVAQFAARHVVHPELRTFDEWADALPALRTAVATMALRLAQAGIETVEGK